MNADELPNYLIILVVIIIVLLPMAMLSIFLLMRKNKLYMRYAQSCSDNEFPIHICYQQNFNRYRLKTFDGLGQLSIEGDDVTLVIVPDVEKSENKTNVHVEWVENVKPLKHGGFPWLKLTFGDSVYYITANNGILNADILREKTEKIFSAFGKLGSE